MAALLEPPTTILEVVADVGMSVAHDRRAAWKSRAVTAFWIVIVAILVTLPFAILLAYGAPLDSRTWW